MSQPGFFQRFLREAEISRAVQHEDVVQTYLADALLHDGVQKNFLVMEYVDGQTPARPSKTAILPERGRRRPTGLRRWS